ELVTVVRIPMGFRRRQTKIMQAADADFSVIGHFLNYWYQRRGHILAQLNQVKAEFGFDLAQHRVASGMASGVPTRGKRNHTKQQPPLGEPVRQQASLEPPVASILVAREQAQAAQSRRSTLPRWPAPCACQLGQTAR